MTDIWWISPFLWIYYISFYNVIRRAFQHAMLFFYSSPRVNETFFFDVKFMQNQCVFNSFLFPVLRNRKEIGELKKGGLWNIKNK